MPPPTHIDQTEPLLIIIIITTLIYSTLYINRILTTNPLIYWSMCQSKNNICIWLLAKCLRPLWLRILSTPVTLLSLAGMTGLCFVITNPLILMTSLSLIIISVLPLTLDRHWQPRFSNPSVCLSADQSCGTSLMRSLTALSIRTWDANSMSQFSITLGWWLCCRISQLKTWPQTWQIMMTPLQWTLSTVMWKWRLR